MGSEIEQKPIALDDTLRINEDEPESVNLLLNDSSKIDGTITLHSVSSPLNGSIQIIGDSSILYSPEFNYYGKDSLSYSIKDTKDNMSTAWLFIFIDSVNDAPEAQNDSAEVLEDTPLSLDVLSNDIDVDSEISILELTSPSHGTAEVSSGTILYSPNENYSGIDNFEYTISDGELTSTAKVSVTVLPVNDAPLALKDSAEVLEDTPLSLDVLANDTDVDSEISILELTSPSHGTAEVSSGTILYSPNENYSGIDSFEYTISDGELTSSAVVSVTVLPVNDAPLALKDSAEVLEDTPLNLDVLANDTDVDSEISILQLTSPSHGTAEVSLGKVIYSPNENYSGIDSFEYTISDGELTSTAEVLVTILPVNDSPLAEDDFISTYEDTPVEINVLINDSDIEQESLEIEIISLPINGIVELTESNIVRYSPSKDYNGSDTFTYKCIDPSGAFSQAVVYIENVIAVNDKPVAVLDQLTLNEDDILEFDPLLNDSDVDGDIVFLKEISTPYHGEVEMLGNGKFNYIPDLNFNGKDSITYSVSDGQSENASSLVIFNVLPVNDPPTANPDFITIIEDTHKLVNVLDNDNDVDEEDLSVNGVVIVPLHGTVKMTGNQLEYFPHQDYVGKDSLCYSVKDKSGSSAEAWVVVREIIPVNDPPVANDDFVNTSEDTPVDIPVLDNDNDVDGDELFVQSVVQPVNGKVEILSNNNVKYSPKSNYFGSDQFEYTVSDSLGKKATARVYIQSIAPVNDAPVARDDFSSTREDEKITVHVLDNDSDIDEDKISIISIGLPENGTIKLDKGSKIEYEPDKDFNGLDKFWYVIVDESNVVDTAWVTVYVGEVNDDPVSNFDWVSVEEDHSATVDVLENDYDPDGDPLEIIELTEPFHGEASVVNSSTIKYTPNDNFFGEDSLQYTVYDGSGNTVLEWFFITVTPVNDAPLAVSDYATGLEDSVVPITVLENDSDPEGDQLSIESWTNGEYGEVVKESGSLIYTPVENFNGTDRFVYTISDGELTSSTFVSVTIQKRNDAPVAVNDSVTTFEDQQVVIDVLQNDIDVDDDPLQISIVDTPAEGSVSIQEDKLLYIPAKDFEGVDRLRYKIDDNKGGTAEANVIIVVQGLGDAPVAVNDHFYIPEDSLIKVDVLNNDFDIEGSNLEVVAFTNPENGVVRSEDNSSLTYVPNPNFNGKDSLLYCITDNEGLKDTAFLIITVLPINDPPVAYDDFVSVKEEESTLISPLINDIDIDQDILTISSHSNSRNGTVSLESDKLRYTPDDNFIGKDTIEYTITDLFGESGAAFIAIEVINENDPPVAYDDFYTANEDEEILLKVLDNDEDPENDELLIKSFSNAVNGDVHWENEVLIYKPYVNYFGNDSLSYLVWDGDKTDTAWVYLTILPVNDAPVAQNISFSISEDESFDIDCSDFVNDVDSEDLHLTFWSEAFKGQLIQNSELSLLYMPESDEYGKDSIKYLITDGELYTDTAFIFIEIHSVNDQPVALNDTVNGQEDNPIIIDVLKNDNDVEDSELNIFSLSSPTNGNAVINSDKSITYTPRPNFNGFDDFNYTIIDDNGAKSSAKVIINKIEPVNDLPVAIADTFFLPGLDLISGNLLSNDFDVDNDELLLIQIVYSPSKGELLYYANGDFEYRPDSTAEGTDRFSYEISDGSVTAQTEVVIFYSSNSQDVFLSVNEGRGLSLALKDYTFAEAKLFQLIKNPKKGILNIANDSSTLQYTPSPGFVGTDDFRILVCKSDASSTCVFLNLFVDVLPRDELLIYQVITPNDDGYNDFWHIEGIKAYPDNKVEVFDLEGNQVYSETGYDNENKRWEGKFGSQNTGGGTFIYFIDLGNGTTFNGTLLIAY